VGKIVEVINLLRFDLKRKRNLRNVGDGVVRKKARTLRRRTSDESYAR
jgi:hypothetical protein